MTFDTKQVASQLLFIILLSAMLTALTYFMQGCIRKPGAVYASEQAACASTAKTLAESKECRRRVDIEWGLADGGGQ